MTDDDYYLRQAARCLKLAERVNDPNLAERLRALAAEFTERSSGDDQLAAAQTH